MIAVAHHPTQVPIQANRRPTSLPKAPIVPERVALPRANSTRISGMDQASRKTTQAMRKLPPPFVATMRGKRQMFPVPTAMPSMASIIPQRDAKTSERDVTAVAPQPVPAGAGRAACWGCSPSSASQSRTTRLKVSAWEISERCPPLGIST